MSLKQDLIAILGEQHVSDAPEVLDRYSKDFSLVKPSKPDTVVWATDVEAIAEILKYANRNHIPVTPRSSSIGFFGAGLPQQGGIVLDLCNMNRILEIDAKDKKVKVEPGVTWGKLKNALAKEGLAVCNPLLPHPKKSVLTSTMEREPMLIPKNEYSEVFRTAEVVLAGGDLFHTGTAVVKSYQGQNHPEFFIPSNRLWMGAQGTLGIVAWANLKVEWSPVKDRVYFMPFDNLQDMVQPIYKIQRMNLGQECLAFNNVDLASILSAELDFNYSSLLDELPRWTLIFVSSSGPRFPDEKLEYEYDALLGTARESHFEIRESLGPLDAPEKNILDLLRSPAQKNPYWKFAVKGARQDLFFYTTLNRIHHFTSAVENLAKDLGYPHRDIGIYLQPVLRGSACFCQFGFPYPPDQASAVDEIEELILKSSQMVMDLGGLFTTPYGCWSNLAFDQAETYTRFINVIKNTFDPKGILNPGKLRFSSRR